MTVEAALAAAAIALADGKPEVALGELLIAWRAVRHPRIVDLVDHVSSDIVAKLPAIKAKSVAARTAAWHAIEKARDPATLGQLLATPWPGTWKHALPLLQALVAWPDDPRMGMAFARIVDDTPYDTWTSSAFYVPLFAKLDAIGDLRTLPLLRAQLAKSKPYYYARDMRALEERSVRQLEARFPGGEPPALDAAIEAAIKKLEAPYVDRIAIARDRSVGEPEHLAAIYANPDDLAARAVYADWLGEHGDPRGEFITLQLARAAAPPGTPPNDKALARERKLLDEHGVAWAGTLASWIENDYLVFEGGFCVGGRLRAGYQVGNTATFEQLLADPACALVRKLWSYDDGAILRLLERPELRSLREIRDLSRAAAETIASGPPRMLESLGWRECHGEGPMAVDGPLATCDSLPALRVLAFEVNERDAVEAWIRTAPVIERCERLVVLDYKLAQRLLEAASTRGGKLREVAIAGYALLQRDDAQGPFTRYVQLRPIQNLHFIVELLEHVPVAWLRELVVPSSKVRLKAAERAFLVQATQRFTNLTRVNVPWQDGVDPVRATPAPPVSAGPLLDVRLGGEGLLDEAKLDDVWKVIVGDLGQIYDSFEVNYSSTLRSLGKDPLERVKKWSRNSKTWRLDLRRDGHPGRLVLEKMRHGRAETYSQLVLGDRGYADFVDGFCRLLELAKVDAGTLTLDREGVEDLGTAGDHDLGDFNVKLPRAWLAYLVGYDTLLPPKQVAALATRPALQGLFVRELSRGFLVGIGTSPHDLTPARTSALAAGLHEIMTVRLPEVLGFDLEARARAVLAAAAEALGFAFEKDRSSRTAIRFVHQTDPKRRLVVEVTDLLADPMVHVDLRIQLGTHDWRHLLLCPQRTVTQLDEALTLAAERALAEGDAFFANEGR